MSLTYVLDTDVVIDYLTGQPRARALLSTLLPDGMAISVITYSEIDEGTYGSRNPHYAETGFASFLKGVSVLPVSRAVARRNARIRLALRTRKLSVTHRALDRLIAATALEHKRSLVTANIDDYDDISGLDLHHPRQTRDYSVRPFRPAVLGGHAPRVPLGRRPAGQAEAQSSPTGHLVVGWSCPPVVSRRSVTRFSEVGGARSQGGMERQDEKRNVLDNVLLDVG